MKTQTSICKIKVNYYQR